ncbi:MAG: hypothetical protein IKW88_00070 [Clostridiales bacterium]|nr:hypothetical protein [Clostridiales bacterium]
MKIIAKTKAVLVSNKAESIVEVIIAFVVLTIVMAMFADGMNFVTSAEKYAIENTKDNDAAMLRLQRTVNGIANEADSSEVTTASKLQLQDKPNMLKLTEYTIKCGTGPSNVYHYYVFDANLGTST